MLTLGSVWSLCPACFGLEDNRLTSECLTHKSNSGGVLAPFSVSLAMKTSTPALLCPLEPGAKLPDNRQLYIPIPQRLMKPFPSTNGCGFPGQMSAQPPEIAGCVTPWFGF